MNRAAALATLDAKVLTAYSMRTASALRTVLPLRLALPHIEPVLAANLDKEISKDALVIRNGVYGLADLGRDLLVERVDLWPVQPDCRDSAFGHLIVHELAHAWPPESPLSIGLTYFVIRVDQ